ncbi:phage antirepressor KilAC domain-containing protein [Leucothrix mucor]|uniref:phage antirepressor KilAC domain-containing protein n=1 Tax=Leucothrix mucor TaxID=45248 RepID=UPI0003B62029|nr:phage antirepressor KilAC domain-containing protein [Leucothrix mucor]
MNPKQALGAGAVLTTSGSGVTTTTNFMSSRDILELLNANRTKPMLLGDLHRDIKVIFRSEIEDGKIPSTLRPNGQVVLYDLPEVESKMLVATKDVNYLRQITEYWINRSKPKAPQLPQTFAEALRIAADIAEQNQILLPKANALDRLSNANGSHSIRDAAKQLKLSPKALCAWVDNNKWCYKNGKNERVAFEHRITSGLMNTRSGVSKNGHSYSQPMITAKGLAKLAIIFKGTTPGSRKADTDDTPLRGFNVWQGK